MIQKNDFLYFCLNLKNIMGTPQYNSMLPQIKNYILDCVKKMGPDDFVEPSEALRVFWFNRDKNRRVRL